MYKYVFIVLVYLSLFGAEVPHAIASETKALNVLKAFLDGEYNGNGSTRDDSEIVRYNSKLQKDYDDRIGGASVYLIYDPLIIINKYQINSILCKQNSCSANVEYNQVAKALVTKSGRKIEKEKRRGIAKYIVKKVKNGWYVYDPPTMMISPKALINHYESQVKLETSIDVSKDKDDARAKIFQKNKADLSLLKSLEDEGDE